MNIDWASFTPLHATAGGVLIGLATALFVLGTGRIAGISGIVGGLLAPMRGDVSWRMLFIGGLLAAPWLWRLIAPLPDMVIDTRWPVIVVAGLLVGYGTRLGSGCTSGHGVCGISRLSLRSLAATALFMIAGFVTVGAVRHLFGGLS